MLSVFGSILRRFIGSGGGDGERCSMLSCDCRKRTECCPFCLLMFSFFFRIDW